MAFEILITEAANRDLEQIILYISKNNPAAANTFAKDLLQRLRNLPEFSEMGRIVPELGRADLRELIYENYRIIYRIRAGESVIHVLRFWHAARGKPRIHGKQ